MFSNYTVKKVLPRLVAAAILLNISYYIVAFAVDISNIVGEGIGTLITEPFGLNQGNGSVFDLSNVGGVTQGEDLTIGIGGGALTAYVVKSFAAGTKAAPAAGDAAAVAEEASGSFFGSAMSIIWNFVLLPALLIFLAIMITLIIRLGLIYLLVLFAPIAFALYTLPNTEQYFKRWGKLLYETLLVFPIISVLFGVSKIMAQLIIWATGNNSITGGIGYILSLMALIAPLVGIPFAFKLAGGVIGRIHELTQGARSKAQEAGFLKRGRENAGRKASLTMATGKQRQWTQFAGSGIGQRIAKGNPAIGRTIRRNAARAEQRVSMLAGELMKDPRLAPVANDTAALRAGMHASSYDEAVQILQTKFGMGEQAARAAAARWDATGMGWSKSAQIAAFQAAVSDGTVFKNNEEQMTAINKIAGQDQSLRARIWGSAYAGNKQAGRYDLSPSYNTGLEMLNDMAAGTSVSKERFAQAAVEGARSTSNTDLSRMKGMGMDNLTESLTTGIESDLMELSRLDPNKDEDKAEYQQLQGRLAASVAKVQNMHDSGMYMPEALLTKLHGMQVKENGELTNVGQAIQDIGGPEGAARKTIIARDASGNPIPDAAVVKDAGGNVVYTVEGGAAGGPKMAANPGYQEDVSVIYNANRGAGRSGTIPPGTPGAPGAPEPPPPEDA